MTVQPLVLGTFAGHTETFSITAGTPIISVMEAAVSGSAFTNAHGANSNSNIKIAMDWNEDGLGDGNGNPYDVDASEELATSLVSVACVSTETSGDADDCDVEWGPISHDYTSVGPRTYIAYAFVCHGECKGQDGLAASQIDDFEIVIPPPPTTGTLTLIKVLPNNNGGTATEDEFNVYIDEGLSSWGSHEL